MTTTFQRQVNAQPAPAVEGDFASANPRFTMLAGAGALVAGALGVLVGRFAFAANSNGVVTNNAPVGPSRVGFVGRDQPVVITEWLGGASMRLTSGLEITLFTGGDFWARFAAGATIGQKVFASYLDGSAIAGTAGSPPAGAVVTAQAGASVTAITGVTATAKVGGACTGAIAADILTVSAVTAGAKLNVGDLLSGPGGASDPIADGTTILNQLTGSAGDTGTYTVSIAQTSTSATITIDSEVVTVSALATGTLKSGQVITGTGWPAGATLGAQLSGSAGSTGDYALNVAGPFAAASTAITAPTTDFTVSDVGSGVLYVGDVLAGVGIPAGQTIVALGTGTGGTGTYVVSIADESASDTVTTTSNTLDVTAVSSGVLASGQPISGSGVSAGSNIGTQLTGTPGGVGTYQLYPTQSFASATVTSVGALETDWTVESASLAGELSKISTRN